MSPDPFRPRRGYGSPAGSASDGHPAWADEVPRDMRPPLVVDTAATDRNAARLRHDFAAWLAIDVTGELLDDLVLAVYEAVANIADHAYADRPDRQGPVRLTAHRSTDAVHVTVADDGHWRIPTDEPYRSRGLPLIRLLVSDVHLAATPTGTVVHLRAALPPADGAPPDPPSG